jgi:hypothetical protein
MMSYLEMYRDPDRTQPLPDIGGRRSRPAGAARPRQILVRLPNGVAIDPVQFAARAGVPVGAVARAVAGAHVARTPAQAQAIVDAVARAYGVRGKALQAIAAGRTPLELPPAPAAAGGPAEMGLSWDDVTGFAKDAGGLFVDGTVAVATGGASLFLPDELKPGEVVRNTGNFLDIGKGKIEDGASALWDGTKWVGKLPFKVAGAALGAYNKPAQQPVAAAPAGPGITDSIAMSMGVKSSTVPLILGGGAAAIGLLVLLTRKKKA